MAELKNRFLYVSAELWSGFSAEQKAAYNNSIVFVKNGTDGVAIYTQGATFGTLDEAEVRAIINTYGIPEGTNYAEEKAALEAAIAQALKDSKDYTDQEIAKVAKQIEDKNVTASGDAYVNATAEGNKVTVSATDSTKASLALADSALQKADITTGSANGTISVDGTDVAVKGLEDVAYATVEDKIISLDGGNLKSTLTFTKETVEGAESLVIKGINGQVIGSVPTAEFVKDGMLSEAELVYCTVDAEGKHTEVPAGTENAVPCLRLVFNTDSQKETIHIELSDLVDVYTAGNGLELKDFEFSVKLAEGEKYLSTEGGSLKTVGIDNAISTAVTAAVEALDAKFENVNATGAGEGEVSVVTGVNLTQEDGVITVLSVNSGAAATKSYVDGQDAATLAAAKEYADSKGAAATTKVEKGKGSEYLTITPSVDETTGAATYTVTVLGIDNAISTAVTAAVEGLDSDLTGSTNQTYTKVVITDGKLDAAASTLSNIDKAQLVDYTTTSTQKYVGIDTADTIHGAFAKCEEAWDWAEITE